MTSRDNLLTPGLRPLDASHTAGLNAFEGTALTENTELLDQSYQKELAAVSRFFEENQSGYENITRQQRTSGVSQRLISNTGLDLLFKPDFGLVERGRGAPVFRYFSPKTNNGIRKFKDTIYFVVMHSFGRGYDYTITQRNNSRTVPIDPETGHSPARFALGIRTLTGPSARDGVSIHHLVSLRGDLVNSVSWDNRCVHGEGGGINGVNDYSIGIEHEEWYIRLLNNGRSPREIEDHGPYTDAQYAIDAFIIKKLEAYTGLSYTNYLGHGPELAANIRAKVPGCFNHASTSRHADPGAEFFLPPGFTIGMDFSQAPMARDRPGAWERRMAIWYRDLPRGTKISAYDRIFDKVARLRSFDLQTEVFDPSINNGRIQIAVPEVTGTTTVAAAQRATQDRLSSIDRAQAMQSQTRANMYQAAKRTNNAVSETWARQTAALTRISSAAAALPVIENALGFDKTTGQWVNATTVNMARTSTAVQPATPATVNMSIDGQEV
jgi:hypothetical protein